MAQRFWMPLGVTDTSKAAYQQRYGRALTAVAWCCDTGNRSDPDYNAICNNPFTARDGEERAVLQSLAGAAGSCALCPDCNGAPPPARGRVGGTQR